MTLSFFLRTSMAFQQHSIAGLITPYITTAHYCLSISSISLDHHDNGIRTQQWMKCPAKQTWRVLSSSSLRSTDLGMFKRKWGIVWSRYTYGKLGLSLPFTDLQHQGHWCQQLCPSWPWKASQERCSNPSHEPGLSSLSNFPWTCNSIKHTHTVTRQKSCTTQNNSISSPSSRE